MATSEFRRLLVVLGCLVNIYLRGCEGMQTVHTSSIAYTREGDINIGVQTGVHGKGPGGPCDGAVTMTGMQTVEAAVYTINDINGREDILPNITLGFVIQDVCSAYTPTVAFERSLALTKSPAEGGSFPDMATCQEPGGRCRTAVAALVGPATSPQAVFVAAYLSLFNIPIVSNTASSNALSDKSRYPYFNRLTPHDDLLTHATVVLLNRFNWTYVSLVYSEGAHGESAAKGIVKFTKLYGICIAYSVMMTDDMTKSDYDAVVTRLYHRKARVIVLLAETKNLQGLSDAILAQGLEGYFIWTAEWGPIREGRNAYNSVIRPIPNLSTFPDYFKKHFSSLGPSSTKDNPWFREFWSNLYKCEWGPVANKLNTTNYCNENDTITKAGPIRFNTYRGKYMDGINAVAIALHEVVKSYCPEAFKSNTSLLDGCIRGDRILHQLRNISFMGQEENIDFDEVGNYFGKILIEQEDADGKVTALGHWDTATGDLELDMDAIDWAPFNEINADQVPDLQYIPESVCAKPCAPKEYYIQKELPCCWECRRCRDNEIVINGTSCEACPPFLWPDEELAVTCEPIPPYYMYWTHQVALILTILAALGLLACLGMAVFYIKYRAERLIKASSRELSLLILVGTMLAYLLVFNILMKPTYVTCVSSRLGFHLAITVIYAPLTVKTNRIYRIFAQGKRGKHASHVGTQMQMGLSFFLIAFQAGLSLVLLLVSPSEASLQMPMPHEKYVELVCAMPLTGLLVPFTFNALMILTCAVYGFLTRQLPENFNESWYIFISVTTTLFFWMAFLPGYFSSFLASQRVILMGACMLLSSTVILVCLFVPKVYAVTCLDESKIKLMQTQLTAATEVSSAAADAPSVATPKTNQVAPLAAST